MGELLAKDTSEDELREFFGKCSGLGSFQPAVRLSHSDFAEASAIGLCRPEVVTSKKSGWPEPHGLTVLMT